MNTLKRIIFLLTIPTLMISCSDDESPNPSQSFVGTYELEDFDVTMEVGDESKIYTIDTNPEVEFERDDELAPDELIAAGMEEFLDDIMQGTIGTEGFISDFTISTDNDFEVEVAGSEYIYDETNFIMTIQDGSESVEIGIPFNAEGELDEDGELSMDFEIVIYFGEGTYTFTGSVTGEQD